MPPHANDGNADRVQNAIDGVLVAASVLVCSRGWGWFAHVWCSSLSRAGAGEKGMTVRNLPPVPCCGGSAARSTVT